LGICEQALLLCNGQRQEWLGGVQQSSAAYGVVHRDAGQFECVRIDAFIFVDILWTMHANVYGCDAVGRDRSGWAVRSKAALLLVLVAKKQGPQAVKELLPQLLNAAKESPTHTEMVRLHSAITVTNVTLS